MDSYLQDTTLTQLTDSQSKTLEKDITVEELGKTLNRLSNNKSPGSDGFPYEFYKVFWGEIRHFVHRSIKHGLATGELSITQREGHITLVPKPSKPRNLISSWRPITLLNSTYKILSATIANRLKEVLDDIIHPDQTAFLKNRFIGENTRVVYDILWDAYKNNNKGMILSVDFKTAFDVMSWKFIERCLLKFNFEDKFVKMFWCLHKNAFSRILYNGHASKKVIQLERGCRQGDPVSCYFFIIGAEVLASKIRQNANIRGIRLRQEHIKLVQYADDTTFFLDGTELSLREVFGELGRYAKFSGLKPNVSKCHAMWIGGEAFSERRICPDISLNWVTKLKLLGIIFNPHCVNIVEENIQLKKDSMMRTIGMWQGRHLTLVGKITIVKTLLLSQITHVLSSLPSPNDAIVKEINKLLFSFIWGSNRNPLKRVRLCQPLAEYGLGMVDLKSYLMSLKIKWIKRLLAGQKRTWHSLTPEILQQQFIWNFGNMSLKKVLAEIDNPFWKDTIVAWMSLSKALIIPDSQICNENIFHSDYTKFKTCDIVGWERKGVQYIGDLFEENRLMTWERFQDVYAVRCNQLEYYGLLHSLPMQMQKDQTPGWYQQRPIIPTRLSYLFTNAAFSTTFVRSLMKSNSRCNDDIIRIECKWRRDINSFEPASVQQVKRSVIATKYIAFQYKLVMRILTTNTFLFLIRRREDDRCTFCKETAESLTHLFLACRYVKNFWNEIKQYLEKYGIKHVSDKQKIFGDLGSPLITHIVVLAKYVIYNARRDEKLPNVAHFQSWLKSDMETERYIAQRHNTMKNFDEKWRALGSDPNTQYVQ